MLFTKSVFTISMMAALSLAASNAVATETTQTYVPTINDVTLHYDATFRYYASSVRQSPAAKIAPTASCSAKYDSLLQDGALDVVIAFGYLDETALTGAPQIDNTGFDHGPIRVSDQSVYLAVKNNLIKPCSYANDNLCGFNITSESQNAVVIEKNTVIANQSKLVRITMAHPSMTSNHVLNATHYKQQQQARSQQVENIFKSGLQKGDVTFYIGHSRDGGGPDFLPPVLRSNLHVDYALYQSKKTGINMILKELAARPDNGSVLGLFSCSSKRHFADKILKTKPGQDMILTNDTVYFTEILEASMGYLSGFMRGYCGSQITDAALQSDRTKYGFADYNLIGN